MNNVVIDSYGLVKHLNIRKEGPNDDKVLAIDIKIVDAACEPSLLQRVLGAETEEMVRTSFWDWTTDEAPPRFLGIDHVASWAELQHCEVMIGRIKFSDCTVKKFRLRVGSGFRVSAEFQVTISSPTSNSAAILAENVGEDVSIRIEMMQGELPLADNEANA